MTFEIWIDESIYIRPLSWIINGISIFYSKSGRFIAGYEFNPKFFYYLVDV